MSNWGNRLESRPVGTSMLLIVAAVVFMLVLIWSIVAVSFGLRVATAGIVGKGEARIITQSAEFRLRAYQSFFDQCASVQTTEASLDAQRKLLLTATSDSDKTRIATNIAALEAVRANAINKYNADARTWTEGQFRDNDLPARLNTAVYKEDGSNKTSCGVD